MSPYSNLGERMRAHLNNILTFDNCWDHKNWLKSELEKVTLEELKKFFLMIFEEKPKELEIHCINKERLTESTAKLEERVKNNEIKMATSSKDFQRRMCLYPDVWSHKEF